MFSYGQVTMTTPELAPPLQATTPRQRENFEPRWIKRASTPLHSGSLVALGLELKTHRPRFGELTCQLECHSRHLTMIHTHRFTKSSINSSRVALKNDLYK
ncbi:hypothetical protein TNCV_110681 [Trichonephila clavipes]|nr:hypothetical protein TNCV_110681 [Trichonephila clavipes]